MRGYYVGFMTNSTDEHGRQCRALRQKPEWLNPNSSAKKWRGRGRALWSRNSASGVTEFIPYHRISNNGTQLARLLKKWP